MQYSYQVKYRIPRTGAVGLAILHSPAEVAVEKARLEALGYVVTEVIEPIGARPKFG